MAKKNKDNSLDLFNSSVITVPATVHEAIESYLPQLYLPLDSVRARVYLGHGLIYPFQYDSIGGTGSYRDLQSHTAAAITLYDSPPPNLKEQLVMRILLTDEERSRCIRADNALLFCEPLPISRVAQIDVPVASDELDTYLKGWNYADIPVNQSLYKAIGLPDTEHPANESLNIILPALPIKSDAIESSIATYNKYMGLFAYMRNADKYFSSSSGCYSDYPNILLCLFRKLIKVDDVAEQKNNDFGIYRLIYLLLGLVDTPTELEQEIINLLESTEPFLSKERARNIAGNVWKNTGELPEIKDAFHAIFQEEDYSAALGHIRGKKLPTIAVTSASLLILLYQFSGRDANNKGWCKLKQKLYDGWKVDTDIAHVVLGAMGLYYGYTALDALEPKQYETDPWIKGYDSSIEEKPPSIKFHLTSRFERVLIETIYQRVFCKTQPSDSHISLYSNLQNEGSLPLTKSSKYKAVVSDNSSSEFGFFIRDYQLNVTGRVLRRFEALGGETDDKVDKTSKVAMRLFYDILQITPQVEYKGENAFFSVTRKKKETKPSKNKNVVVSEEGKTAQSAIVKLGFDTVGISINRKELVELIADGIIPVDAQELELWVAEDENKAVHNGR